jgi:hypothetical protein
MERRDESTKVEYVTPEIRTVSESEILEAMGPAQAYTGTIPFGF